jgi:SAM-dependent methyltransferase
LSSSKQVEDIIERIRKKARLRAQAANPDERSAMHSSPYHLNALPARSASASHLADQIGEINPRRPGLLNDLAQKLKRALRRMLSWYTRPLRAFDDSVIGALAETAQSIESLQENLAAVARDVEALTNSQACLVEKAFPKTKAEILGPALDSQTGRKAEEWFSEPVILRYDDQGRPSWTATNSRVIEKSWILRHLGGVKPGARILDVGSTESLVSLELASNGFLVTGVDVCSQPLKHPNFHFVQGDFVTAPLSPECFDAAILLSTMEGFGFGWYGDPKGDGQGSAAMAQIYRLLKTGGRLLLTVPFGKPAITPRHRIFGAAELRQLLSQFEVQELEYGIKTVAKTWLVPVPEEQAVVQTYDAETYSSGAVALVVCKKA